MFRIIYLLLFCIVLLSNAASQAQTISVNNSPNLPIVKEKSFLGYVYNDSTNIYLLSADLNIWTGKHTLFLEKFDPKWKVIAQKSIEVGRDDESYTNFYYADNGFTILSTLSDRKNEKVKFLFKRTDMSGKVGETNVIEIPYDPKKLKPTISSSVSKDHSKALCFVTLGAPVTQNLSFEFAVSDGAGKNIWGKKVDLPYKKKDISLEKTFVDNDGNVYFIVKVGLTDKEKPQGMRGAEAFRYELHRYAEDDTAPNITKLDLKGKGIQFYGLKEVDGMVCMAAFCTNLVDPNKNNPSILSLRMSCETGEITSNGIYQMTDEDITKLKYTKEAFATNTFVIDNVDLLPNGNMLISMENFYTVQQKNGDVYTTSYIAEDIFNFYVAPDGKLVAQNRIPKMQSGDSRGRSTMSYRVFSQPNGDNFLFFNSNSGHLKAATNNGELGKATNGNIIACLKMSPDGTLVSGTLPATLLKKTLIMYYTYQISDTQFFFHSTENSTQTFGIITIE